MNTSPLLATILDNTSPSTSGDFNISYHMTPSHPPPNCNNLFTMTSEPSQRLNKAASKSLKQWFDFNGNHPYQNKEATTMLAITNNFTLVQCGAPRVI